MNLSQQGLAVNVLAFAVAAALVWAAGTRLTGYLDAIATETGMGRAFMGMLILGGITSLPEVAAVSTAAWTGNAAIATNNLLGSVMINIILLAIADAFLGRDALTSVIASPATLLQGTMVIIVLAVATIAILSGDVPLIGVGVWPGLLLMLCIAGFWMSARYGRRAPWRVARGRIDREEGSRASKTSGAQEDDVGLARPILKSVIAAVVILFAGFLLARSAENIANLGGIGAGLVGLVLVGFATSLPELSSVTEAVRRKQYEMALGDVFGTNLLTIALIFLVDAIYPGGPVINEAGNFEAVAALLGAVITGIFVLGVLERQNKSFLRMGYDSIAALGVFAAGLVLLYSLQAGG